MHATCFLIVLLENYFRVFILIWPGQTNVLVGMALAIPAIPLPPLLVFTILLVSVDCCSFAFFGVFSGDFGFLYSRSIPDFLLFINYFLSVSRWAPFS